MENILLIGTGGHSGVILDTIESSGIKVAGFVSKTTTETEKQYLNYPLFPENSDTFLKFDTGIICIGDNWLRSVVTKKILQFNPRFNFINAIHPSATVSKTAVFGVGIFVGAGVCIGPGAKIHDHCLLNTHCSVDHDSTLGSFSSLGPGVICGGQVTIGNYSAIGLGSNIIHSIEIGKHSVVGAGSVVVRSVPGHCVAFGSPCKFKRERKSDEPYL